RRRHTRSYGDWSSDVCSSDLGRDEAWSISRTIGDAFFLLASFLTGCFTVTMRQAKLEPLHATSLVATGSMVMYLPIYLALCGAKIGRASCRERVEDAEWLG